MLKIGYLWIVVQRLKPIIEIHPQHLIPKVIKLVPFCDLVCRTILINEFSEAIHNDIIPFSLVFQSPWHLTEKL